jgi:molecular chaperone GrpE
MEEEKNIEPARNASHSDAGGEKLKEEVDEIEKKVGVKKDIKKFFKKAEKKESKEEEYLLGWRRCMADFENYKKRQQESAQNIGGYIREDMILQIIPVIDNFHSATEHIPEEQKNVPWVVGVMYIQKQLEDVLKENGVTEMDVKVGDEFDPNLHEAISDSKLRNASESTNENRELKNKIKKIVLKGYKLGPARNASHSDAGGEKVIRAARVIVE